MIDWGLMPRRQSNPPISNLQPNYPITQLPDSQIHVLTHADLHFAHGADIVRGWPAGASAKVGTTEYRFFIKSG
jgi:hypothetical protein